MRGDRRDRRKGVEAGGAEDGVERVERATAYRIEGEDQGEDEDGD